jgi:hypothetical protein
MTTVDKLTKAQILALLDSLIRQRSGIEFGNYGDVKAFRSEQRSITRDLHDARTLLRAIEWRDGIGADELRAAFRAFSGRLTLADDAQGRARLDYCTGQYFPTEYRKAVAAVCAAALWDYYREHCMPAPAYQVNGKHIRDTLDSARLLADAYFADTGAIVAIDAVYSFNGKPVSAGEWLRRTFAKEFGRSIARRYFD